MAHYSIKNLEEISNQKAHTIRIWEQRYGLLTPRRTDTNIRFYDDKQLKKLLNVCALMGEGMKISKISKLTDSQINDAIQKIITDSAEKEVQFETIINQAIIAVSAFDELSFDKIFSNAILRFGLKDTYLKVIYPMLVRVGLMWSKDDIMPAQEHFFSNLIKQKLFASIDATPFPQNTDQTWVLFLNEKEDHEIGLLMASYILRVHGKKVIYLGQKVPYDNIAKVIDGCKPTHLYTFFVKNYGEEDVTDLFSKLRKDYKQIQICVSGKQSLFPEKLKKNRVTWIKDIDSLLSIVKNTND